MASGEVEIPRIPLASSRLSAFGLFDPNPAEISAALTNLVSETTACLEAIWNEVGYSSEEKSRQLQELLENIRCMCETKIGEEQLMRDHFAETIAAQRAQVVQLAGALQVDLPPALAATLAAASPGQEGGGGAPNLSDRLAALEKESEGLKARAAAQAERLAALQGRIAEARGVLGGEVGEGFRGFEEDLTEANVARFEAEAAAAEREVAARRAEVGELVALVQHAMGELRMEPATPFDDQVHGSLDRTSAPVLRGVRESASSVGLGDAWVARLQGRLAELRAEKERRKAALLEVGARINALWERLKVPQAERDAFQRRVAAERLGPANLAAGEAELARLEALKRERLGQLVEEVRAEITELWDAMSVSPAEREDFAPARASEGAYTDDLLAAHEAEAARLRARRAAMEPLFRLAERREELLAGRAELEELQADSSRLLGRGKGAAQALKRLTQLEKETKRLPKLSEGLRAKLLEWEKEEGPFVVDGARYIDRMKAQDREYEEYKEGQKAERARKKEQEKAERDGGGGGGAGGATPGGAGGNLLPRGGGGGFSTAKKAGARTPGSALVAGKKTPSASSTLKKRSNKELIMKTPSSAQSQSQQQSTPASSSSIKVVQQQEEKIVLPLQQEEKAQQELEKVEPEDDRNVEAPGLNEDKDGSQGGIVEEEGKALTEEQINKPKNEDNDHSATTEDCNSDASIMPPPPPAPLQVSNPNSPLKISVKCSPKESNFDESNSVSNKSQGSSSNSGSARVSLEPQDQENLIDSIRRSMLNPESGSPAL